MRGKAESVPALEDQLRAALDAAAAAKAKAEAQSDAEGENSRRVAELESRLSDAEAGAESRVASVRAELDEARRRCEEMEKSAHLLAEYVRFAFVVSINLKFPFFLNEVRVQPADGWCFFP